MFVRLVALECIKTKGETEEEPYLCVYIGDDLYGHLGPWDMRRGDTEWLNFTFEGSTIRIILRERDPGVFKDEHYGGVELTDGCEVECDEHGRSVFTLPPEGTTRYKLYLDSRADNDNWRVSHHCLELVSLHCHDAQEKSDSVYIKVNGATVWGPQEMETGDIHRFRDMDPFSIPRVTEIQLWEEDSSRDDLFGQSRLEIREDIDLSTYPPLRFNRDRGCYVPV